MNQDIFIFCKESVVQYAVMDRDKGPPALALLAARGEANAKLVMQQTPGTTAMRIGSVDGEIHEKHIQLAMKDGCEGSWMRENEGWRWTSWADRPKPPPTRLTDAQIRSIGTDCQLTQQIERADIIAAINVKTAEQTILWRRPGLPKLARTAKLGFSSKPELRKLREAIDRLKTARRAADRRTVLPCCPPVSVRRFWAPRFWPALFGRGISGRIGLPAIGAAGEGIKPALQRGHTAIEKEARSAVVQFSAQRTIRAGIETDRFGRHGGCTFWGGGVPPILS